MNKKGKATGTGASTLILVIGLIIVLYILFLPPEERRYLLEGENETTQYYNRTGAEEMKLLVESPGTLDVIKETKKEHMVSPLRLYSKTTAEVLKSIPSFYVSNSFFDTNKKTFGFEIPDLNNTKNIIMTFTVPIRKGRLIIALNDNEIFNSLVTKQNVDPIELPKKLLQKENTLLFFTNNIGWRFWAKNQYQVENLKITAEVVDTSQQQAKSMFLVSSSEKLNLKKSSLRFVPDCVESEVGPLKININNMLIYNSVPDCKFPVEIEFSPSLLRTDENYIEFSIDKGQYLIDNIAIKNELKEPVYPIYYFKITKQQMDDVYIGKYDVELYMQFADNINDKRGTLIINGVETNLDQKEMIYSKIINPYITSGNNAIEIIPRTRLDIVKLEVRLIK